MVFLVFSVFSIYVSWNANPLTLLVALSQFPTTKQVHQLLFVPDEFEVKKKNPGLRSAGKNIFLGKL